MSNAESSLPPEVLDALRQGNTIAAIKLLRAATGLGLKEAKDAIDAHLRGAPVTLAVNPPVSASPDPLPAPVVEALQRGNKVEAIALLRAQTGLGLAEAKYAIEASAAGMPAASTRSAVPGTVPQERSGFWWLALLAAIAVLGYYVLYGCG